MTKHMVYFLFGFKLSFVCFKLKHFILTGNFELPISRNTVHLL